MYTFSGAITRTVRKEVSFQRFSFCVSEFVLSCKLFVYVESLCLHQLRFMTIDYLKNYGFTFQSVVATLKEGFEEAILMFQNQNFELLICLSYYQIREQPLFSRGSTVFGKDPSMSRYKMFDLYLVQ